MRFVAFFCCLVEGEREGRGGKGAGEAGWAGSGGGCRPVEGRGPGEAGLHQEHIAPRGLEGPNDE